MSIATEPTSPGALGSGPAWEIARLFPDQGRWSDDDYFLISERTNRIVELVDGRVEIPEMPGRKHQRMLLIMRDAIQAVVGKSNLGEVLVSPYPVRVNEKTYREPDVIFMRTENLSRMHDQYSEGADLVVEVVSQDRKRDLVDKRKEYALARIPEYWIVDPAQERVTVLKLVDQSYIEHGSWTTGGVATSLMLPELQVDVGALFE